ncbi:PREDICTED: glypican-5-like [Priapulus caudatus]|uniref:Glypican-5-like n=1 Tax=Priapulus caudatus TaxID=37621 RepID=A0ABM1E516_PRICU|nr:PREDICTED: glypican-5-like [Priapulus caudatus]
MATRCVLSIFLIILSIACCCSASAENVTSCQDVAQVFAARQLGSEDMVPKQKVTGEDLQICSKGETCCTHKMEGRFHHAVNTDIQTTLTSQSAYVKHLMVTSVEQYEASFMRMIKKAENNTNILFADVYRGMAAQARAPVGDFFLDLEKYVRADPAAADPDVDLRDSVNSLFDALFPLVFHHTINPKLAPFSRDYSACLAQVRQEAHPFGEAPHRLMADLRRAFSAARVVQRAQQQKQQ